MDEEQFQQMEKRLNEQAEATQAMNETLNKFLAVMANQEAARNVASPPPVSPPHVGNPLELNWASPVTSTEIECRDGFPHILQALYLANSIGLRRQAGVHSLGTVILQGQTCGELRQVYFTAGTTVWKDVLRILARLY
jgi:hypothetical protein